MSRPGALPLSERTVINGGGTLPKAAAVRFERADDRLLARFGFRMRVLPDDGPYRTRAKQNRVNPAVPPDYSEHCVIVSPVYGPVAAADIDNQSVFRMISERSFIDILAAEGIFFHVLGERWHGTIRNTYPTGAASAGSSPLLSTKENDAMTDTVFYVDNAKAKPYPTKPNPASGHPGGTVVGPLSMWYQEHLGAPLKQLSLPGKAWNADPATELEYRGWREHQSAASSTMTGTAEQIGKLIELRGLTV